MNLKDIVITEDMVIQSLKRNGIKVERRNDNNGLMIIDGDEIKTFDDFCENISQEENNMYEDLQKECNYWKEVSTKHVKALNRIRDKNKRMHDEYNELTRQNNDLRFDMDSLSKEYIKLNKINMKILKKLVSIYLNQKMSLKQYNVDDATIFEYHGNYEVRAIYSFKYNEELKRTFKIDLDKLFCFLGG